MKMPFSIKRFTIHRSSSLPTHGGSEKESSAKEGPASSKKGGASDKKPSSRPRGLPTSQSVDTADLRRYNGNSSNNPEGPPEERVPPLPPHDRSRQFDWPTDPRNPGVRAVDGGPRWRSSGKERGPRLPGDVGYEIRRAMARRNGNIRYPDNDYTEESQSSSSSGGTGRDYIEDQKISSNPRWSNGRRGGRSVSSRGPGEWSEPSMESANGPPRHPGKRSQGRRHHPPPQEPPPPMHDVTRQDLEESGYTRSIISRLEDKHTCLSVFPGRHPLYTTPPLVGYDEDPGIMSEVETSATGFRTTRTPRAPRIASFPPPLPRGGKAPQHPSERHLVGPVSPQLRHENLTLGLVFLQYRSETKRALLPNEVTTLDTVKALFVRSFPKQLTMEYLDSPHIRIYIHDPAKDMFYELEDLRDIRDRSVLRIYEQESNGEVYSTWEQELSYFSEPEFDSEYQNQHIHRAKGGMGYYGAGLSAYCPLATQTLPPGPYSPPDRPKPPIAYAQTLPWGTHLTYAPSGPPGPERRPGEILIPAGVMQPPPKPQRSFQQGGTLPLGKGIRCTPPPPTGPPPSIPSPRSGMPRPMVDSRVPAYPRFERRHEPQGGGYRPERPYSAGAQPIYTVSPEGHYEPAYHHRKSYDGGYLSSPERRGYDPARSFVAPPAAAPVSPYEEPYYGGTERIYGTRSGSVTPVVDEEARLRVEHMERQLASLTGLVQKALAAPIRQTPPNQQIPTRDFAKERGQGEGYSEARSSKSSSCASLADESSDHSLEPSHSKYSFKEEKSVSFSDETTTVSSPVHQKQHSPQHPADRPVKPAIKSSLSLRSQHSSDVDSVPTQLHPPMVKVTSADREPRSKPAPPPKPSSLSERQHSASPPTKEFRVSVEMYSQLRHLRKQTKDLRLEVRNLRRIAQSQALTAKETVRETCLKIKTMLAAAQMGEEHVCAERLKVSREEELYRQDVNHLEKDLLELESQVEELRGNVINRKCRVNLSDVEGMALVLSRASKAVAELKARFPQLQESLKTIMAVEMEVVVREEKFLKDEPERLENALRRCKKLTGTLVTLKSMWRGYSTLGWADQSLSLDAGTHTVIHVPPNNGHGRQQTALDALLNELQTFTLPAEQKMQRDNIPGLLGPQRRLPSYPSADSPVRSPIHGMPQARSPTNIDPGPKVLQVTPVAKSLSPTPQQQERRPSPTSQLKAVSEAVAKKVPPPPPPRTTSRSPVTSPTEAVTAKPAAPLRSALAARNPPPQRSSSVPTPRGSSHPTLRQTASTRQSSRERPDPPAPLTTTPAPGTSTREPIVKTTALNDEPPPRDQLSSNSSSSESVNSQEGLQMALAAARAEQRKVSQQLRNELQDEVFATTQKKNSAGSKNRQELLEARHQELLRKQKQLQEQYTRLQQIQRGQVLARLGAKAGDLKKTGSESNILSKAGLLSLATASGSMQHLAVTGSVSNPITGSKSSPSSSPSAGKGGASSPANKIFETDIL